MYVGCIMEKILSKKFNGHMYDVTYNNVASSWVAEHFVTNDYNFDKFHQVHILKKISSIQNPPKIAIHKTHWDCYICKLLTFRPKGMNFFVYNVTQYRIISAFPLPRKCSIGFIVNCLIN